MEKKDMESGNRIKNYIDLPAVPLTGIVELKKWSFYRAIITEFTATGLFLYVTMLTIVGAGNSKPCGGVGALGVAWAFGGMIFLLVYSTAGLSGGHMNPAVTFGFFLARKISLTRTLLYMVFQCLGAICGACLVKSLQKDFYVNPGGGANVVSHGYSKGAGLAAEIMGTFVLVFTVFSASDPKRMARDSHVPVLAPLPIGFAVFTVHLATIPITGTGINPARSFGAAVALNMAHAWEEQWIFWVGPLIGSALATLYHEYVMRSAKVSSMYRSTPAWPSVKEVIEN